MALILNIETSTTVCSVSVSLNGIIQGIRESSEEKTHAKLLTIFIDQLLKELNYKIDDFDAIAVSKGPGSYTGLRIGVSTAKGLCYAKDIPLIAINTLQAMANGMILRLKSKVISFDDFKNSVLVPMIDARRMEVYSAFFNFKGEFTRDVKAEIIDENSYMDILSIQKMIFFGDGSEKIREIIKHENAIFVSNFHPSSDSMVSLSELAFQNNEFENAAYFEPFYLKDFVATIPRKNIFK
ncbi:MAG: tRNA (adenosine(37)-N6)-threonylcarbamoyltransferase complex dimerization subunit type 1 TsaB [Bacteroidales bacterium]|jgi:tRNA threonylcarbamoyladenosine biosynthesis protein TsaB|nr:tRNA (adenosine(37)-N6)-threonylcarbamoyltransferase complex dimerization subunit type 1 TsaB [Bacteroidales bacterium]